MPETERHLDVAPGDSGCWYALYTRHQHEKVVAEILANKGFDTFLPLYQTVHQWQDRAKLLSLPLFPCYVFIRIGLDRRLSIVTTPGVHGFVAIGKKPAVIPSEEIDAIRQVVEQKLKIQPHPFLQCGDWVRVKWGPLEGVEGVLVRKKGLTRLVLSVELLQQSAAVEVDAMSVARVARRRAPKLLYTLASPRFDPAWRPSLSC